MWGLFRPSWDPRPCLPQGILTLEIGQGQSLALGVAEVDSSESRGDGETPSGLSHSDSDPSTEVP